MLKINLSTGRRLIVDYDECPENPRDLYGCESRLIVLDCLYRSWGADDEMCAADLSREVKAARRNGCKVFPVYTDGSNLSTSPSFASCICLSAKQIGALIFPKGTKDARKLAAWELETLSYWANGLIFAARIEHPNGFEAVTDDCLAGIYADDEQGAALCAADELDLTASESEEIRAAVKGA